MLKTSKMTLKQIIEDNFACLLRCMEPSIDLLGRLRSVPFVKDRISSIGQQLSDDHKNNALLSVLCEVPDDIQELVMNGFMSSLKSSGQEHVANIFHRESDKVPLSDERYRTLMMKTDQLCRFIEPDNGLLDKLVSTEVISFSDAKCIRAMTSNSEKAQKLIEVLTRKSDDAFEGFISALNQTGQSHVTYILTGEGRSGAFNEGRERDKVPMSLEHYRTLIMKTDLLCRYIELDNGLLDKLVSTEVISLTDVKCIRAMTGYNEKVQRLMDILTRKSDDAFDGFINALNQTEQSHITYILTGESDRIPLSDEHYRTLMVKTDQLCRYIEPDNGLLDKLVSTQIISLTDAKCIRAMTGYNEKVRKLIEVLLRKSDDAFDGFVSALNETGQSHITYILTGEGQVPMSDEHYHTLTVKKGDLCEFIDTENKLLGKLVRTEVISPNDEGDIRAMAGYNEKARKLLEVLMRKSDNAFDGFINALNQSGQSHVIYMLTGEGNSRPLKDEYRQSLLTSKREYLVNMIDSKNSGLVTALMNKQVFSSDDEQRVTGVQPDTANDRNEVILNLIARKSQSDFFSFLSALNDTGQTHVVVNLIGRDIVGKIKTVYESGADGGHIPEVDAELLEYMREMFQNNGDVVRQLNGLLANNGVSVSSVREGCIEVTFTCESIKSLHNFHKLNNSGKLEHMLNEAFCFQFAKKGLKSLKLEISSEQFEQCADMFTRWMPMTSEHRMALLSSEEWLVDKMRINDDLLDKLSLCSRRRQAIEQATTQEQQVKTLIDIVSRQPDSAFTQLLSALKDTEQHEVAAIISDDSMSETSKYTTHISVCNFIICLSSLVDCLVCLFALCRLVVGRFVCQLALLILTKVGPDLCKQCTYKIHI